MISAIPPSVSLSSETLTGEIAGAPRAKRRVAWLFEADGRRAPSPGFGLYLMVSALGVVIFLSLLMLGSIVPNTARIVHPAALVWFLGFGAFRISTFSLR